MANVKDLTNIKFNNLTVISENGRSNDGRANWLCKCDCGNLVCVRSNALTTGNTKSCGCLPNKRRFTHGASYTLEYRIWDSMIQRCCNSNDAGYANYGGMGIMVCYRWRYSFENFITDMGHRPSDQHSIDRIDNDGNYEPSNCKWSTSKEQANNRRCCVFYNYKGKEYTVLQISKEFNINPMTFRGRIARGLSISDSIETPVI